MFGIDEETGMAVEYDECAISAVIDSARELRSLEEKREEMNGQINSAAEVYMTAIDGRIVSRDAELLRIKWYNLIDARREVDIQIEQVKSEIVANAMGVL